MTSERKNIAKSKGKYVEDPPKLFLPPDTTAEDATVTAGQRHINRVWEYTQSLLAVMITVAEIYNEVNKIESAALSNAFFLVVSVYIIRTNHSLVGGVGPKPAPGKQQR